jgi:hypothetical protein
MAQVPNEVLVDKMDLVQADSGRFGFSIYNTNYMRNTEYFNPIEEGRTLFGYQVQPSLFYQVNSVVKIEAGLWLRHDFGGNNPYTSAVPTFRLKAANAYSEIIFGTLEGALSHGMLEPMMNINSVIENRIENGFQYKLNLKKIKLDTWINWENFITQNEFDKERFTAGVNGKFALVDKPQGKLYAYYQLMVSHQGGQIDTDTISPFMMQINQAIGLTFERKLGVKDRVLVFDIALLNYNETSDSKMYPETKGNGFMGNVLLRLGANNFQLSYWNAQNFIAPRGTSIYQSVSTYDPLVYEKNRQLLFVRFIHNKALFHSPIVASARVEPVYDLNNGIFDFSYSLYLVYRGNWSFKK